MESKLRVWKLMGVEWFEAGLMNPWTRRYTFIGNLGGGFKYFLFSHLFGEGFQFDEHIFQLGWFNHQLEIIMFSFHNKSGV